MSDILNSIESFNIVSIKGGSKDNVIPSECVCIISTDKKINITNDYKEKFPSIMINVDNIEKAEKVMDINTSKQIVNFLYNLPGGVITYFDTSPQTSINLASIETSSQKVTIKISIRSSSVEEEKEYIQKVRDMSHGMEFLIMNSIPFFEYKKESEIRQLLVDKYKELYNKQVRLEHVHAGLEGGVFAQYIKDIDICVIAPNLYDIHSVKERVEIESVNRVYNWLIAVLEEL